MFKQILVKFKEFWQQKTILISAWAIVLVIAILNLGGYISGPIPMMCLEIPHQLSRPTSRLDLSGDVQGPGTVHCYSPLHKEFWDITQIFHLRFFLATRTSEPGMIIHL